MSTATDRVRATAIAGVALAGATLGSACAGATVTSPEVPPPRSAALEPRARVGEPGCALDASPRMDRQMVVLLEEGRDPTAATRSYTVDTYGIVDTGGIDSIAATIPPEREDGEALAGHLISQLEGTGVLALPAGCYGEERRSYDAHVVTLAIPHQGRIHRVSAPDGRGPAQLQRAVALVRSYVRHVATREADGPRLTARGAAR